MHLEKNVAMHLKIVEKKFYCNSVVKLAKISF
jgi:DNA-binding CsgD family transcriptional regulator